MKNLVKSLIIVLSCLVANVARAEDPTLAINTEEQGTTDFLGTYATEGITLSSSVSWSSGTVQIGNTANGYDQHYFEVLAGAKIDSISFLLSGNGSNKSIQAPVFGWEETATSNNADTYCILNAVTVTANSYDAAQWFTYDFSNSDIKCARIYRSSKNISSKDPAYTGSSTALGSGQTIRIWGLKVWLAGSGSQDQPVESVTITGPSQGAVGVPFKLTAKAAGGKASEFWWTEGSGTTHISDQNVLEVTPDSKGTFEYKAWAKNEYNTDPASATHTIEITVPSGEIIKATTTGVVSGVIGGTYETNLGTGDTKKLDKNKYFGFTLAYGTFAEKDTFVINITEGANLGKCMIYADKEGNELIYDEGIVYTKADADEPVICPTGLKKIVLPETVNGKSSLYLYRENGNTQWNPKFSYIAVIRPEGEQEPIPVTGVSIDPKEISIEEGKTATLTAIIEPKNADNKKVTWNSNAEGIAKVDDNGIVTGVAKGDAIITVKTADGGFEATCKVTVTEPAPTVDVTGVELSQEKVSIIIGQTTTLTAKVLPENASDKTVEWSSNKPEVATVTNGVVKGIAEGTATITAKTVDGGFEATCEVTVKPVAVESVSLAKTEATIKVDATLTLTAKVLPENATNKDVKWSSNKETVVTVDNNGKVTGIAEGEAIITVKTVDGEKTAECKVKVEAKQTPQTDLKLHTSEVYEDPAGYNTPLVKFNDREYEVYYTGKGKIGGQGNTYPLVYTDAEGNEISDGTKAKDRWFVYNIAGCEDKNGATKDEFTISRGRWKAATDNDSLIMRVKGYDCFRLFAADKKEADPKQQFHVYIDDMTQEVSMTHSESASIREFTLSTDEHVIKIEAKGTSNQYIFGWSLRVSNDPLVRQVAGPKEQTVYQTKEIEPTAYVVRRAAKSKLAWKDDKAAEGISMTEGTNDSVFVSGKATAAVGTYTYIVQALDAEDKVAATETGTLTIETHVFDCERGNDFKAEVGEQIRPLSFKFYAANKEDITLNCDIEGLTLTKKDSVAVLEGTPSANTAEGEYTYSIKAAGGNTVSGTITVSIPDPYFEPIAEVIARINQQVTFALIARHAENVTVTGLPGFTCKYDKATDKATITGTPTVEGEVQFTAKATPRYQGKQTVTADGKLIVIGQNEKIMLVVHKDLESINDEPVAKLIKEEKGFYVTMRKQEELEGSSVEAFDFLFISENVDADHKAVQQLTKEGGKPMLNMKAFTYSPDRLNWGQPNNGTVDTVTHNGQNIFVERNDHPIFEGKQHGDTITILSQIVQKGVMPITINSETLGGSYCLATAYTRDIKNYYKDGELQTFLHEIPAAVRGKKYICMPIALSSSKYLTDDGKNLVSKVVDYLMDEEPFTLPTTELQINSFVVEGFEATIEANYTIELEIPANRFQELDSLKHAKPVIELEDPIYTHVSPESGEEVDLHYATFMPVVYEVTNYIKRQAYDVYVRIIGTQGIEGVYSVGEWVNIYDIFGRKVTTTNEDVYQMELPRGVYIVVTSEGQTLKIMR